MHLPTHQIREAPMYRFVAVIAALGLTGCTAMINKKLETVYAETAMAYSNEDVDGAMDGSAANITRVLPDGTVLEGQEAVRGYLQDLFEANDDINLKLVDAYWGGDGVVVIVYHWTSKVVGQSKYSVDLTGTELDNRGVALLYLNDEREVERMEDYYDYGKLAKPAGYTLMKPPPPMPEPAPEPEPVEQEEEEEEEDSDKVTR